MSILLISIPLRHLYNRLLSLSILTHPITPVVPSLIMTKRYSIKIAPTESSKSSTWRELRTVDLELIAFALELQGKKVAWFTDNTSVVSIVHSGSNITELKSPKLSVFNLCARHGISLKYSEFLGV